MLLAQNCYGGFLLLRIENSSLAVAQKLVARLPVKLSYLKQQVAEPQVRPDSQSMVQWEDIGLHLSLLHTQSLNKVLINIYKKSVNIYNKFNHFLCIVNILV